MYPNVPEEVLVELLAQGVSEDVLETLDGLVGSGVDLEDALSSLIDEIIDSGRDAVDEEPPRSPTYSPRKGLSEGRLVILPAGSFDDFLPEQEPDPEEEEEEPDEDEDEKEEEDDWDGEGADCPSIIDSGMVGIQNAPPATAFSSDDGVHVAW